VFFFRQDVVVQLPEKRERGYLKLTLRRGRVVQPSNELPVRMVRRPRECILLVGCIARLCGLTHSVRTEQPELEKVMIAMFKVHT